MLGVCYHPEYWPEDRWPDDVRAMVELGVRFVRIGEFAWARYERTRDRFDFDWLDRVLDVLGLAGLQVVLCTPTAAPPPWLVEQRPEILAWDVNGRPRRAGARRHYCFSSQAWREETARICALLAKRYGRHAAVVGWQLDNQYGAHDTVLSYAPHCRPAFQRWLARRYGAIERLNEAWGAIVWGQDYDDFAEVGLPQNTATQVNPAHMLDFHRFASHQVIAYNRMQAEIVRQHSPERFLLHNAMPFCHDLDHRALAEDLDLLGWSSYPLALAEQLATHEGPRDLAAARGGDPDLTAFQHDVWRGVAKDGRFWVMEQQVGPLAWPTPSPAPAAGMVRLWTLEARAHGAEVVSFQPWRQAPFGPEQMQPGLLRADAAPSPAMAEVQAALEALRQLDLDGQPVAPAEVALLVDDESQWVYQVQPEMAGLSLQQLQQDCYGVLRRLGMDVDVLRPGADLAAYRLVLVPSLPIVAPAALDAFKRGNATVIFGPRSGSQTAQLRTPDEQAPGALQALLRLRIEQAERLPAGLSDQLVWQDQRFAVAHWRETISTELPVLASFADGAPAVVADGRCRYLAFWPSVAFLEAYLAAELRAMDLAPLDLPATVRLRRRGDLVLAFNYGPTPQPAPAPAGTSFLLGGATISPRDVAVWRR